MYIQSSDRAWSPILLNIILTETDLYLSWRVPDLPSAKTGAAGAGEDGADGGGFDLGSVIKMVGGLTNKGTDGSGADGFMQLLQGFSGSGGTHTMYQSLQRFCDVK